jgi:hypothetical protein
MKLFLFTKEYFIIYKNNMKKLKKVLEKLKAKKIILKMIINKFNYIGQKIVSIKTNMKRLF